MSPADYCSIVRKVSVCELVLVEVARRSTKQPTSFVMEIRDVFWSFLGPPKRKIYIREMCITSYIYENDVCSKNTSKNGETYNRRKKVRQKLFRLQIVKVLSKSSSLCKSTPMDKINGLTYASSESGKLDEKPTYPDVYRLLSVTTTKRKCLLFTTLEQRW